MSAKERFRKRLAISKGRKIQGPNCAYMISANEYLRKVYPEYLHLGKISYYTAWLYQCGLNQIQQAELWQREKKIRSLELVISKIKKLIADLT